jgi:uncharacterized membrane protein YgcG
MFVESPSKIRAIRLLAAVVDGATPPASRNPLEPFGPLIPRMAKGRRRVSMLPAAPHSGDLSPLRPTKKGPETCVCGALCTSIAYRSALRRFRRSRDLLVVVMVVVVVVMMMAMVVVVAVMRMVAVVVVLRRRSLSGVVGERRNDHESGRHAEGGKKFGHTSSPSESPA